MKKRILACLLAAMMTMPMIACGNGGSSETTVDTSAQTAATEAAETEPALKSGVPEGTTFGGETVSIWYTTKSVSVAETYLDLAGENSGETLDDAMYYRNIEVEELLDVVLNYFDAQVTTDQTGASLEKLVMAGDTTYDMFSLIQWNASKYAYQNMYYNMKNAPYISFDQPWWNYDYMKEMTIGEDKIYCMVGDVHVDSTRCMNCIYYNKAMYTDYYDDGDGMYDVVLEGNWTFDLMQKIAGEVWMDLDGDNAASIDDQLGYSLNDYNNVDGIMYACGVRATGRDENDVPVLTLMSERAVDALKKTYDVYFNTVGGLGMGLCKYATTEYEEDVLFRDKFSEGTTMFLFGFFYTAESLRDMDDAYGIIPFPKLDEEQDSYYSIAHDIISVMCLPVNCQKVEAASAVLEALAFIGYEDVLPAYYESLLKAKYARDAKSAQMIELIRDNFITDIAYVYGGAFNDMGYACRSMVAAKQESLTTWYASKEKAALTNMEDLIEQFQSIEG